MNSNIKNKKNKYLTKEELHYLEGAVLSIGKVLKYIDRNEKKETIRKRKQKVTQMIKSMAKELNKSEVTIRRELKRGEVILKDIMYYDYITYSAQFSIQKRKEASLRKRIEIKAREEELEYIAKEIKKKKSIYAILEIAKREHKEIQLSNKTVYNYVSNGELERYGITKKDLLYNYKLRRNNRQKKEYKRLNGVSIERRAESINKREEIGHWEIDTVKGKSKGKSNSLLVLTERVSRLEIIKKISRNTADNVKKEVEKLIKNKEYIIKTITSDNGTEFMKGKEIKGIEWFYCHPYSSYERGSNEVQNKMIRRFIPKGTRIRKIGVKYIKQIEELMNTYPRKIFNGKSSIEVYEELVNSR